MEDLHTQHEDVTGDASRAASSYLTMALVAAQKATDIRARRLDRRADTDILTAAEFASPRRPTIGGPPEPTRADDLAAERSAYEAMLGLDQGKRASSDLALEAWLAGQRQRADDPGAELVAGRAEARLRALHPDAMARYDTLRHRLDPIQAMHEVTPLIVIEQRLLDHDSPATDAGQPRAASTAASSRQDTSPAAAAARTRTASASGRSVGTATTVEFRISTAGGDGSAVLDRPELRYTRVVREVLEADLAAAVLHDDAWPVLATALEQAHRSGVEPGWLLADVAAQRELTSAKHPAQVLNFRVQHRTVTAADVVISSFPTTLTTNALPTGPGPLRPGTDPAVLRAAHEPDRDPDPRHAGAQAAAASPVEGLSSQTVNGPDNGLAPASPTQGRAAADQAGELGMPTPTPNRAAPAVAIAAQNYPVPVRNLAQRGISIAAPATPARGTARPATAATRRR